jgi:hypothetical protein
MAYFIALLRGLEIDTPIKNPPLTWHQSFLSSLGLYNQHQYKIDHCNYPKIYIESHMLQNTYFLVSSCNHIDYAILKKRKLDLGELYEYNEYRFNKLSYHQVFYIDDGKLNCFYLYLISQINKLELIEFYFKVKLLSNYLIQDVLNYITFKMCRLHTF